MQADKEKVVNQLKIDFPDLPDSRVLEYIERAEEFFLNETNRLSVPQKAFWLWVDIAKAIKEVGATNFSGIISNISRGDTSITFATGDDSSVNLPTLYQRVKSLMVVRLK